MPHLRISDWSPGDTIDACYIVRETREGTTRTGNRFLTLTVADASGTATGRVWSPDTSWPVDLVAPATCRLRGRVESYRDELQLNIEAARAESPPHEAWVDLMPASRWSPDVLWNELRTHVATCVRSEPLRRLLLAVLDDDDVRTRFPISPAAVGNHHAYRAGLVEHTLSMMRLATLLATHYAAYYPGRIDGDVLVAGVLLHDLAKIWELEGELAPAYSTPGRLVGHIPMGATFIAEVAARIGDVPDELVWELQHLVLSHHGELEYGAAQRPMTAEAQILHYIDQIDAKANYFANTVADDGWTGYLRIMQRPLLNPASMRETWTSPPPGEIGERGPGHPAAPSTDVDAHAPTARIAPEPASADHDPPASPAPPAVPATAAAVAPDDGPQPPPGLDDVPPPSDDDAPAWAQDDDHGDEPAPRRKRDDDTATLSLFDGLDP